MYRYLILIWNPADPIASAAARSIVGRMLVSPSRWSLAFEAGGVTALHSGLDEGAGETLIFEHGAGAVFGRIFRRGPEDAAQAAPVGFDSSESLNIVRSGGRRLLERYWGRYVAVAQDRGTAESWILRDPSGGIPCLLASYRGIHLAFSDVEDCLLLGILELTVNWRYIRGLVAHSSLQTRDTALEQVSELQPGERVMFSGGAVRRALEWNPFAIARSDPVADSAQAIVQLRDTTRTCVHAWASCYTGIVHNLSGGLDSSIVLSCLKEAPSRPEITCLHYYGDGPEEDERRYARLMASRANAQLIEHRLHVGEVRLERILKVRRSARPWFYMYELEHGEFERDLVRQRRADSLFSGAGGDGVFFQAHADLAVADYLFDHGVGRGVLRVAVDAARMSRRSIWPLLLAAVRRRLRPRWNPIDASGLPTRTLVSADVMSSTKDDPSLEHPWFTRQAMRGVPPGLLWHALTVAAPPAYYSSFTNGPYPERTLPLLSQPLVELCLRIPTYVLIRNGVDRATARRAFAPDLPPEIVRRRNKGRIDRHVRNTLDANLPFVRDVLLNGRLVKEGLLDRRKLELYLTRECSPADFEYTEILHQHLCTEAWLSRWLDAAPAAESAGARAHRLLRI